MTLDPQNTMIDQLSYSANLVEIVASIKYLAMEISHLKDRMESLEEMMRVLEWRMDYPNGE